LGVPVGKNLKRLTNQICGHFPKFHMNMPHGKLLPYILTTMLNSKSIFILFPTHSSMKRLIFAPQKGWLRSFTRGNRLPPIPAALVWGVFQPYRSICLPIINSWRKSMRKNSNNGQERSALKPVSWSKPHSNPGISQNKPIALAWAISVWQKRWTMQSWNKPLRLFLKPERSPTRNSVKK